MCPFLSELCRPAHAGIWVDKNYRCTIKILKHSKRLRSMVLELIHETIAAKEHNNPAGADARMVAGEYRCFAHAGIVFFRGTSPGVIHVVGRSRRHYMDCCGEKTERKSEGLAGGAVKCRWVCFLGICSLHSFSVF